MLLLRLVPLSLLLPLPAPGFPLVPAPRFRAFPARFLPVASLDFGAAARSGLILVHLLAFSAAATAIAFGDYAIFAGRQVDRALLARAAAGVSAALALLWLSGLALVWIDTRFDPAVLAARPKTLAKLTIVLVLSVNGVALHRCVFPALARAHAPAWRAAALPAVLGAISAVSWLFAACVGVDKVVASTLGYAAVIGAYAAALGAGLVFAWGVVRPRLARKAAAEG